MTTSSAQEQPAAVREAALRPVAVIDVGATSIRMAIAEVDGGGGVNPLETLSQAVSIGKDTFIEGTIKKSTIEECVRVLKSYQRVLQEYQILRPEQIRAVATSAVREARNRLSFLDRIYIATGIQIVPLDEAEVTRLTYLAMQPFMSVDPSLAERRTIITEIGGGSTELLLLQDGRVRYSHTYRLGSLRLRETLEAYRAPALKVRTIMESHIRRTVDEIRHHVDGDKDVELIALGGDVRFAAAQLVPDWGSDVFARVEFSALSEFTDRMLELSVDEIVRQYHLTFPNAETLGPALLAYVEVGRAFSLDHILVTRMSLRDGLLQDMATKAGWSKDVGDQIMQSALDLGRKYDFDEPHGSHVARLCDQLFEQLQNEHQLDSRHRLILRVAGMLHDVGNIVNNRSHHKHSMYLIQNSELFGLSKQDLLSVALVARYHRRASPNPAHEGYATLDRDRRVAVAKMAAMLRVADALDRSDSQRVDDIKCERDADILVISVPGADDLSLEQLALRQKGSLFDEVFGMQVLLRTRSN